MTQLRPGETAATHRWSEMMYWPLTAAALLFLITYTIHVVGDVSGLAASITATIISLSWLTFVIDYVVRLLLSRPRSAWFRSHLASLGMVLIPALRPVRLLDAFTRFVTLRRSAAATLRARLLIYGIGSALLLIWYVSLVVLQSERDAVGASITTFGDAVWWAFCTVTTVGYGDYAPVTVTGRIFAVLLMAGGVVLVGLIVATISSAVVELVTDADPGPERLHVPTPHLRPATKPRSEDAPPTE